MNRDRDRVYFGDDVIVTFSARVTDIQYGPDGQIRSLRLQSPGGTRHFLVPRNLRDFAITAIPDEPKARWSA
jgi:hypothetical protein